MKPIHAVLLAGGIELYADMMRRIREKMIELQKQLVTRPYPTGDCIMMVCSRAFPDAPQSQLVELVAIIKEDIKKHELICNLAKQNQHAN